jgi:hypothetical protein
MPATEPGAAVVGCVTLRGPIIDTFALAASAGVATTRPGSMACRSGERSGRSIRLPDSGFTGRIVPGRTCRPCLNALVLMAAPQGWPCEQGKGLLGLGKPWRGVHPIHPGPPYQLTSPGDHAPKLPGNHTQPMPGMNSQ